MNSDVTAFGSDVLQALTHSSATDIGKRREENQDSYGIVETDRFRHYFVCDGMGGVKGGAVASNIAVQTVSKYLREQTQVAEEQIIAAVEQANSEIFAKGSQDQGLAGMGTTLTGITFIGPHLYITNVGDSRVYRVRNTRIAQLSEDHTLVRELIRSGSITPDQAENHPVSHMLTRSLGPTPSIEVDCGLSQDGPARGDVYLLCSDGLYNLVNPREMIGIIRDNTLDDAAKKLIDKANERGGTDNITVILVRVGDNFPFGPDDYPEEVESIGVEDTLELYLQHDQVVEKRESEPPPEGKTASSVAEAVVGKANGVAEEDSPRIAAGVSFERVAANVAASHEEKEIPQAKVDPGAKTLEQPKPTPIMEPKRFRLPDVPGHAVLIGLVTLIIGYLAGSGWFASSPDQHPDQDTQDHARNVAIEEPKTQGRNNGAQPVLPPREFKGEVARVSVDSTIAYAPSDHQQAILPGLSASVNEDSLVNLLDNSTGEVYGGLTRLEMEHVSSRKMELRAYLSSLDDKLQAFDKPLSGKLAEMLRSASREREVLRGKFEEVKVQIDVTARKLSVWYGRQKRLQTTDPLNLATEVSVSSTLVKEKKEIFERATWGYLQEAEVLRYNPADINQEEKVRNLMKLRKQRMGELTDSVREAIENEVRSSDQKIAELTVERDQIEVRLEALEKEVEYSQIIMGNDVKARDKTKEELTHKRQVVNAELDELNQLLPDGQEVRKKAPAAPTAPSTAP